jgi:hypothetical protein
MWKNASPFLVDILWNLKRNLVQGEKTVRWSIVAVMGDGRSGLGDQTEEVEVPSRR